MAGFEASAGQMSGFFNALGQIQQGFAQSSAEDARAAAYERNAQIADMNAQAALAAGQEAKRREERRGRLRTSGAAAKFLKSGVSLEGSPLMVLGEEAEQSALAAADLLHEQQVRANAFRNQAQQNRYTAKQVKDRSSDRLFGTFSKAGQTLLGGLNRR